LWFVEVAVDGRCPVCAEFGESAEPFDASQTRENAKRL